MPLPVIVTPKIKKTFPTGIRSGVRTVLCKRSSNHYTNLKACWILTAARCFLHCSGFPPSGPHSRARIPSAGLSEIATSHHQPIKHLFYSILVIFLSYSHPFFLTNYFFLSIHTTPIKIRLNFVQKRFFLFYPPLEHFSQTNPILFSADSQPQKPQTHLI